MNNSVDRMNNSAYASNLKKALAVRLNNLCLVQPYVFRFRYFQIPLNCNHSFSPRCIGSSLVNGVYRTLIVVGYGPLLSRTYNRIFKRSQKPADNYGSKTVTRLVI